MTQTDAPRRQFTAQQQAAIDHPLAPLLVVAGAGSGKTTVMAARIATIAQSVDQRTILGLTFSNKAAAHLRSAVITQLGADSDVVISTYHGFGASLVNRYGDRIGWPRRLRLLDHAQSLQLMFDVFEQTSYMYRKTGKPIGILQDALGLSSKLSDHLVSLDAVEADCVALINDTSLLPEISQAAGKRSELIPLIRAYRARKQELGLLDHDDQIALAYQIVSTHSDIASQLRQAHQVVLLDEYQDTNFAQRRLLQIVYGTSSAPAITAVGDDMQSIYAFRGAHVANLHGFSQHFGGPPHASTPLILSTSFRNDEVILTLANRVQANVDGAQNKELMPHDNADRGELRSLLARDSWDEATQIATHISSLISAGTPASEIAVLCRKRRLIGPIVDALEARNVDAEVIGIGGLLARPEVIELCCWLEVIGRHTEQATAVPLLRLLTGPRYRIGLHDLAALASAAFEGDARGIEAGLAQLDRRQLSPEAVSRLTRFVEERSVLRQSATELPLVELIETILAYTGLWQAVDGDLPAENLARFIHVAEQFRPLQGGRTLDEFLNWLAVMGESETDLSEAVSTGTDAVQVMTIHQSKGLEFDHVVIPGLAGKGSSQYFPDASRYEFPPTKSADLPHWLRTDNEGQEGPPRVAKLFAARAQAKDRQLAEEWRLLYVAITRARHSVLFSAAHWYGDTVSPQGPSLFFDWITKQDDLVQELAPPASSADEAPGVAERRRRQDAAADRRLVERASLMARDQLSATTGSNNGSGTHSSRSRRNKNQSAQLGFAFAATDPELGTLAPPKALPVSAFVLLARCARQFHWTHVRPMPRQASEASVIGTRVHSWIESHGERLRLQERQPSLFATEEEPEPSPTGADRLTTSVDVRTSAIDGFQRSFLRSRFGSLAPLHVELPILLDADGLLVRGRVDAVYPTEIDNTVHVVDYKTGRHPLPNDPGAQVQLDLYGLAAHRQLGVAHSNISVAGLYLNRDGSPAHELTQTWSSDKANQVTAQLHDSVNRIRRGDQQPHTGSWCHRCVYAELCPEGQAAVNAESE
jgi:DNA helicase II / ATP-dependent DNA helicase PcrA